MTGMERTYLDGECKLHSRKKKHGIRKAGTQTHPPDLCVFPLFWEGIALTLRVSAVGILWCGAATERNDSAVCSSATSRQQVDMNQRAVNQCPGVHDLSRKLGTSPCPSGAVSCLYTKGPVPGLGTLM